MCKDNKKTVNGTQGVAKIRFFTVDMRRKGVIFCGTPIV
jgi:hypothetical protein